MLIKLLVLLAAVCIIAFVRLSRVQALILAAVVLLVGCGWSWWWVVPFVAVAFVLLNSEFRQKNITSRVLVWFKSVLPEISDTEQAAIDAGTIWWDGDLFTGDPDWNKWLALPKPQLTEEEQAYIDGPIDEFCQMLDEWQITAGDNDLPPEAWAHIKKHKIFGLIIPKEYGGMGFSALAHSEVVMKIASRSYSAAVTCMVPNSLGPAELLVHYGTEAQRQQYLSKLAVGEHIPCFALTAPTAGSDAGAIPDTGVVCKQMVDGKEVIGFRTNWGKRYITLGPIATVLGLAFKAYDPDGILGDQVNLGITCALIPTDTKGVSIGNRHLPLNSAFMNGPNWGKDVFIPLDWVIGGQAGIGEGWKMLMNCLGIGRSISLPSLGVAAAKMSARFTGAYATIRRQFKMPIGSFEGVEEALAQIAGHAYFMDAARRITAHSIDQGQKPSVLSAVVKYHLTEGMRTTLDHAMDVHGGKGIILGPNNYLARHYQATPVSITVEGANILTRSLMIFGQGAMRCHPYVMKELQAVYNQDSAKGLADFDDALMAHVGFAIRNNVRAFVLALSRGVGASAPVSGELASYYKQLSRLSAAFTALADISMFVLGGELKRKEALSGRMGDALSFLYIGSTVLKRFENDGRPHEDLPLVHWSMQHCLYQIQEALSETIRNYPSKAWATLMRLVIFPPLAKRYHRPSDELGHEIVKIIMQPGSARDRLTCGMYVNTDPQDCTGKLEHAFLLDIAVEPIRQRVLKATRKLYQLPEHDADLLAKAVKEALITQAEADQLKEAAIAVQEVVRVDDFTKEEAAAGGIIKIATAEKPAPATRARNSKKPAVKKS